MPDMGDFALGATFDVKFCTVQSTGAPTTLAGSPVISAYPDNSTTELTAGITLSVDFDSRTGLNNVRVVATGANGYLAGSNYTLVITTGTVNSVSAVGYVVGTFSIQARPVQPSATGATPGLAIADAGTAQAGGAATITLAATASATDHTYEGDSVLIWAGTGAGQAARPITGYVGSTQVATVDGWTIQPDNTSIYLVVQTPVGSVTNPPTALLSPGTGSGQVTLAAGILTANANGDLTATQKTSVTTAATAATPTAAAVTGNVGGNVTGSVGSTVGSNGVKKNTAKAAFMFVMTDATLHTPKTGLTVTFQRALDGAAFGNGANAVAEIGSGWYKVDLAASDVNGNTVAFKFTAAGADQLNIGFITAP